MPVRWRRRCEELCPQAAPSAPSLLLVLDGPAAGPLLTDEAAAKLVTPETLCAALAAEARKWYLEAEGLVEQEEEPFDPPANASAARMPPARRRITHSPVAPAGRSINHQISCNELGCAARQSLQSFVRVIV